MRKASAFQAELMFQGIYDRTQNRIWLQGVEAAPGNRLTCGLTPEQAFLMTTVRGLCFFHRNARI